MARVPRTHSHPVRPRGQPGRTGRTAAPAQAVRRPHRSVPGRRADGHPVMARYARQSVRVAYRAERAHTSARVFVVHVRGKRQTLDGSAGRTDPAGRAGPERPRTSRPSSSASRLPRMPGSTITMSSTRLRDVIWRRTPVNVRCRRGGNSVITERAVRVPYGGNQAPRDVPYPYRKRSPRYADARRPYPYENGRGPVHRPSDGGPGRTAGPRAAPRGGAATAAPASAPARASRTSPSPGRPRSG